MKQAVLNLEPCHSRWSVCPSVRVAASRSQRSRRARLGAGLVAGAAISACRVLGELDLDTLVSKYTSEVKESESTYCDVPVRQLMDMTVGVRYSGNHTDQKSDQDFKYGNACMDSAARRRKACFRVDVRKSGIGWAWKALHFT